MEEVPLQEIHTLPTSICQKWKKTTKMWLIYKTQRTYTDFPFHHDPASGHIVSETHSRVNVQSMGPNQPVGMSD